MLGIVGPPGGVVKVNVAAAVPARVSALQTTRIPVPGTGVAVTVAVAVGVSVCVAVAVTVGVTVDVA
jgi:hypothetical protein